MAIGGAGQLAGLARVSFEAVTGEFNADVQRAEATYRDATRGMSDDAIKLELSQERLRRELAKGPANYRGIARAELEVRRSEQALRGENERLERQFRDTGRAADRMGRGMLAGSGALRGLGRNLAFASAGFLGGTGLVYGLRSAISAASNLEEQTNKTRVVFGAAGDDVVAWSKTTATSFGIASDQALQYAGQVGGMLNTSGLAREEAAQFSKQIVQLAADMASFNNEDPSDMLDRIRSGLAGEAEPLRRFSVLLSESAVKQEAYRIGLAKVGDELTEGQKVQARYSLIMKQTVDQQGDFARTADGLANSQRTLSALWREANILVGQALVPAFTDAVQAARDWLAEDKNRADLQREVNKLLEDGEKIVRGLVGALKLVKAATDPVVEGLGGIENAVKTLALLWVGLKVKALLGFGATAAASRATAASMVRDAALAGRAWDAATRPRFMSVATTTTGTGGIPTAPGAGPRVSPRVGVGAVGVAALLISILGPDWLQGGPPLTGSEIEDLQDAARSGRLTLKGINTLARKRPDIPDVVIENLRRLARQYLQEHPSASPRISDAADRTTAGEPPRGRGGRGGGRGRRAFTFTQFEAQQAAIAEARLDAEASPGTADDVRLAQRELALVRRALRELELTRDQRVALKQRRNALLAELDRMHAEDRSASEQRASEQKARRAERIRTRIGQRERRLTVAAELAEDTERDLMDDKKALVALRRFYGEQAQNDKLTLEERQAFADKRRAVRRRLRELYKDAVDQAIEDDKITERERRRLLALGGSDLVRRARRELAQQERKGKGKKDGDELTAEDLRRMLFEFTTGLHGVIGQYAGNVGEGPADFGLVATHAQMQTHELRAQTKILADFTGAVRHPMTGYHRTEATSLLHGFGF